MSSFFPLLISPDLTILFPLVRLTVCLLVQIISYTQDAISFGSPQFEGRVGFQAQMPSVDVSLLINNTQESDSGRYFCQVVAPGIPSFTKEFTLEVKGNLIFFTHLSLSLLIYQHEAQIIILLSVL